MSLWPRCAKRRGFSLRHLTDDELDQRLIENVRQMIAGHSSVMDAIAHFRGTGDAGYVEMADTLEEGLPMIRDVIARQSSATP